jgi:hypothetical protein
MVRLIFFRQHFRNVYSISTVESTLLALGYLPTIVLHHLPLRSLTLLYSIQR